MVIEAVSTRLPLPRSQSASRFGLPKGESEGSMVRGHEGERERELGKGGEKGKFPEAVQRDESRRRGREEEGRGEKEGKN